MLERQENADIAGARVDSADERDHQQRPEGSDARKSQPGREHQQRGAEQQRLLRPAMPDGADSERCQRGARERRRAQEATSNWPKPSSSRYAGRSTAT